MLLVSPPVPQERHDRRIPDRISKTWERRSEICPAGAASTSHCPRQSVWCSRRPDGTERSSPVRQVDSTVEIGLHYSFSAGLSRAVRLSMHNGAVDGFKIVEEAPELSQVYGIIPRLGELLPMSTRRSRRSRRYSWGGVERHQPSISNHGPDGDEHGIDDWYLDGTRTSTRGASPILAKELEGKGRSHPSRSTVQDTAYLSFPRRFGLGDIITVDLDDAQFTEQLQRVDHVVGNRVVFGPSCKSVPNSSSS